MKIIGIIVEYNPLHNGHTYHISEIKKQANPDLILAVMSSNFTMRGDLSLFDKFTKTKQALQNEVDIVIELPLVLCMQRADLFAENAILLLHQMNVSEIWIGSEENNPKLYEKCYNLFQQKEAYIQEELKKGYSYKEITNSIFPLASNDLLGYSYYKAIKENAYSIELKTIQRISSNYLDENPASTSIASALSIRKHLDLMKSYTPSFVYKDKELIRDEQKLFNYLKYKILSTSIPELKKIFFVDEGIEYKLKDIKNYTSLDDFISYLTTKRYTSSRIKRMLIYILFSITKEEMNSISSFPPSFVRILGYSSKGRAYISSIKKSHLIYTNIKEGISLILDIELKISKILDFIYNSDTFIKEQGAPVVLD